MYAWMITKDHIEDDVEHNAVNTIGPSTAPLEMCDRLIGGEGDIFEIFDDDGILYYTGRALADEWDEAACAGPLDDFGHPNAGAVRVDWPEHPDRNIG